MNDDNNDFNQNLGNNQCSNEHIENIFDIDEETFNELPRLSYPPNYQTLQVNRDILLPITGDLLPLPSETPRHGTNINNHPFNGQQYWRPYNGQRQPQHTPQQLLLAELRQMSLGPLGVTRRVTHNMSTPRLAQPPSVHFLLDGVNNSTVTNFRYRPFGQRGRICTIYPYYSANHFNNHPIHAARSMPIRTQPYSFNITEYMNYYEQQRLMNTVASSLYSDNKRSGPR
ncbi:uncharacterized protein LOC132917622 [Rhopalosiphum padi]|uniref:uncharacterized protein LOC132917622 n=1 Tax=Rhopalosiphum padi TaxID=40932 RepID=UPI00298EA986|nr:uncharacterized protein LOC132917622 [Rhopalosiphum padi]